MNITLKKGSVPSLQPVEAGLRLSDLAFKGLRG